MYAFYHPNNDVLNGGRPMPAAGLDARTLMHFDRRKATGGTWLGELQYRVLPSGT